MTPNYPDICPQTLIDPWWEEYSGGEYRPGRLVWVFLPHIDQVPYTLEPIGREMPTEHRSAKYKIKKTKIGTIQKKDHLPVSGMPLYENEAFCVFRTKRRPAIIISKGGPFIERVLTKDQSKWRTNPTMLLAPSYSADKGFKEAFLERVRTCEYPQFLWDDLPIGGTQKGSIIRFDHLQPIGRSKKSIQFTKYCLSDNALTFVMEWIEWLISGQLNEDSEFCKTRSFLISEA